MLVKNFTHNANMTPLEILFIFAAYLIGSISTAIIVCKIMSLPDPRNEGSGNPGATNVLRVGGKKAAAITLFGDMLKGFLPIFIASFFLVTDMPIVGRIISPTDIHPTAFALIGLAAFLGHLYPVFFGFKGGKGVATMLGVLFGIHWSVGLATALTWLIMAKGFKISSLSALIATALAPFYVFGLLSFVFKFPMDQVLPLIITCSIMTVILFWRHRSNIQNILSGKEGKIGKSS